MERVMGHVLIAEEKLVKDEDREGFYIIPGFERYSININGVVFDRENLREPTIYIRGGYPSIRLRRTPPLGVTSRSIHRLLAITFLDPSGVALNDERLVVNHLDGNKANYSLNNLEWTTDIGNIIHAGFHGLTPKSVPISVRDVDTGEVTKWSNFIEYARYIGVSKDYVRFRLKYSEDRVWPERKQYRKGHKDDPWFMPDDIAHAILVNSTLKSMLVKYLDTGAIVQFRKLTDAAFTLNIAPSTLSQWLARKDQPILPGNVLIKYATDETPWRYVENPDTDINRVSKTVQVIVLDENTGMFNIYDSAADAAIARNLTKATVHQRIPFGVSKIFSDNCRYARLYEFIQETTVIPTSNSGLISSLTAGNSQ